MNNNLKNILSNNECLTTDAFYNYLENNLTKENKHVFESHLNGCELCEAALIGFKNVDKSFVINSTKVINNKIDDRVTEKSYFQYFTAASVIFLLFFSSIYLLNQSTEQEVLSVNNESLEELNKDELRPDIIEEEVLNLIKNEDNLKQSNPLANQKQKKLITKLKIVENIELENDQELEEVVIENEEEIEELELVAFENEAVLNVEETMDFDFTEIDKSTASYSSTNVAPIVNNLNVENLTYSEDSDNGIKSLNKDSKLINYKKLITFASQQLQSNFTTTEKLKYRSKKSTNVDKESISYNYTNIQEIQKIVNSFEEENYHEILNKIIFQKTKDVWTDNEFNTLIWLESIANLKLNNSSKKLLKTLKNRNNPYKKEADLLYKKLY